MKGISILTVGGEVLTSECQPDGQKKSTAKMNNMNMCVYIYYKACLQILFYNKK